MRAKGMDEIQKQMTNTLRDIDTILQAKEKDIMEV